jgi:hypothetical protein
MVIRPQSDKPDLDSEEIEMLATFSDYAFDYPDVSFEEIAKKLGVDFSRATNGKVWEAECRGAFEMERRKVGLRRDHLTGGFPASSNFLFSAAFFPANSAGCT